MREKLNKNPVAQIALIGVLLVAAGFLALSSMGGEGGEGASSKTTTTSASVTSAAGTANVSVTTPTPSNGTSAAPTSIAGLPEAPAPALPRRFTAAFAANRTVVLLIVKKGGVEEQRVTRFSARVAGLFPNQLSLFVVPAEKIARYAAVTQGLKIERVPALIVLRPKRLDHGIPTASVSYGYQSPQSVVQAVIDARYRGRTLAYHP